MSYSYGLNLTESQRIEKNIHDMVELQKGTVPYDRDMGVDTSWIHKQDGRYTAQMLTEISDMLNEREDRVNSKVGLTESGEIKVTIEEATDD